ncbi:MAG: hypothetical protein ACREBF_00490 [Candidatus Micrarchaeales archaeon]
MGGTINKNGKLYKTERRITFVMSPKNGCPRFSITGNVTKFRDDFGGRVKSKGKLIRHFTSV